MRLSCGLVAIRTLCEEKCVLHPHRVELVGRTPESEPLRRSIPQLLAPGVHREKELAHSLPFLGVEVPGSLGGERQDGEQARRKRGVKREVQAVAKMQQDLSWRPLTRWTSLRAEVGVTHRSTEIPRVDDGRGRTSNDARHDSIAYF